VVFIVILLEDNTKSSTYGTPKCFTMRLILSSSDVSRCSTLDTSVLDTQDDVLLETTPVTGTGSLSVEAVVAMVTAASGALLTAVGSTLTDRRLDAAVGALDGITVATTDGVIVDWTIVATCTPLTPIVTITIKKATHDKCSTMDCTTMD